MTKKIDLRIIKTKNILYQTLIELMQKIPFEEIKVTDICEKALINRSTFYAHFSDKYELLSSYIDTLKESLEEELKKNQNIHNTKEYYLEMLRLFFNHVDEKRLVYQAISKTNKNSIMMDMIYDTFKKEIIHEFEQADSQGQIPNNFVATFYIGAVYSVSMEWLAGNFSYSKKELIQYLDVLLPDHSESHRKSD